MRITGKLAVHLIIALWLLAAPAAGIWAEPAVDEFSHPSGFKFWLPDDWKVEGEGDNLSAEDKKGTAAIEFYVPKNIRQFDRALDDLEKELNQVLKNIRYDDPVKASGGGVERIFINGTGADRESGTEMEFSLCIYAKNNKILLVFAVTASEVFDDYEAVFLKILESVR